MTFKVNITSYSSDTTVEILATELDIARIWSLCFCAFNVLLLLGILIIIFLSWYKITAWRQFKNYIFLNIIITVTLLDVSEILTYVVPTEYKVIVDFMYKLSVTSFSNWLLIMCMVIYTKIVKVFSGKLQHKYLKVNAFAWGMSIFESILATYVLCPILNYILNLTTYVILGFYLSIIYALVKLTLVRMVSSDNSCQIWRIFVYVTSAFMILIVLQVLDYFDDISEVLFAFVLMLQVVMVTSFITMKSHRELWAEHLKRSNGDVLYIKT